jgi:hypothetical protein
MLEQVRKSRLPHPLVLRPDVIPDAHRHKRHAPILVDDDVQAVGEYLFLKQNVH